MGYYKTCKRQILSFHCILFPLVRAGRQEQASGFCYAQGVSLSLAEQR